MPPGEHRLFERLRRGDPAAYREFVDAHQSRVYRTVVSMIGNREDARDVTQEVFLKAFEAVGSFRGGSSASTWLYRIAVNMCIDQMRSRRSKAQALEVDMVSEEGEDETGRLPSDDEDPLEDALRKETQKRIVEAMDDLSEEHRTVIVLREVEGMAYDEIAEVLGIGVGTVMSRLHYARGRMKKKLRSFVGESEDRDEDAGNIYDSVSKNA
ncbi:MAG: sigma-70 family RNA polymerase sigma factor [Myxococcota bacterium]